MANTLTDLLPNLYAALDTVSRELVGFIPAVNRGSGAERAALNETVEIPVTRKESVRDVTPGVTAPDDGDATVDTRPITITRARKVPIRFNGEETQGLKTADSYGEIVQNRVTQGMRTIVNEIEGDLASLYTSASQAFGIPGTAPFGTKDDLTDVAGIEQILDDNAAPTTDRQLVAGSPAWFNLRGVQTGILQKVNESGTAKALREGEFEQIHNVHLRNSAQIKRHTAGSVTDVTANANTAGTTAVDVETASTTGDISLKAGDVISFSGHPTMYVVAEDVSAGAGVASTTITINRPGLQEPTVDGETVTAESDFTANMGFHRNAINLATRAPALPEEGDGAEDRFVLQDPVSGLSFEVASYRGYHQLYMEVAMVWGFAATKEEHLGLLLG